MTVAVVGLCAAAVRNGVQFDGAPVRVRDSGGGYNGLQRETCNGYLAKSAHQFVHVVFIFERALS